jgi:hypothetical protein
MNVLLLRLLSSGAFLAIVVSLEATMTGNHWSQRVREVAPLHELQEVRSAARDLSHRAGHLPGKTGLVMQKVTNVVLLGTAVISGTLALYHLWKALARKTAANHAAH